jgi:hypothetical protein
LSVVKTIYLGTRPKGCDRAGRPGDGTGQGSTACRALVSAPSRPPQRKHQEPNRPPHRLRRPRLRHRTARTSLPGWPTCSRQSVGIWTARKRNTSACTAKRVRSRRERLKRRVLGTRKPIAWMRQNNNASKASNQKRADVKASDVRSERGIEFNRSARNSARAQAIGNRTALGFRRDARSNRRRERPVRHLNVEWRWRRNRKAGTRSGFSHIKILGSQSRGRS